MRTVSPRVPAVLLASFAGITIFAASKASADPHTAGVPVLNSDAGAPFTLYLDFAGFNYTGTWSGGEISQPGSTPAFNLNGEATNIATFTAADQSDIKTAWSRVAQSYSLMNVNVTTVDPAAGLTTDLARQNYYDATPDVMHMVIGSQIRGTGAAATNWYSYAADGVSGLGVLSKVAGDAGSGGGGDSPPDVSHTNWMFTESLDAAGSSTGEMLGAGTANYVGAIAAHENGHATGLYHQSDYVGTTLKNEYGTGDSGSGAGTYVATMGQSLSTTLGTGPQRTTWRSGPSDNNTTNQQNDIATMLAANPGMNLINDGIGHTLPTATLLPLTGTAVNAAAAKGIIVPASQANPTPGVDTSDYFAFFSNGVTPISLTATDGSEYLVAGTADGVGPLQSTLTILTPGGSIYGTATEDPSTLFETYNGTLPAGEYYADITSLGAHAEDDSANPTYNPSTYFNDGSFFLSGSGFAPASVPEPTSVALVVIAGGGLIARRRRSI